MQADNIGVAEQLGRGDVLAYFDGAGHPVHGGTYNFRNTETLNLSGDASPNPSTARTRHTKNQLCVLINKSDVWKPRIDEDTLHADDAFTSDEGAGAGDGTQFSQPTLDPAVHP
jgi:hypothetical protein